MGFGIGSSFGTKVNDVLGFFGIKGAGVGLAIDTLTGNSIGQLTNLRDMYLETAMGRGTGPMERVMGTMGGFSPFLGVMSPFAALPQMMPLCGAGYTQTIDLAPGSSNIPFFSKLFDPNRRAAGQFEHMLRHNPFARAAFEAQIGGQIVDFGLRNDGKFTVQRFAPGFAPIPGMAFNPLANTAIGALAGMNSAVLGQVASLGGAFGMSALYGANPFSAYAVGGLQSVLGGNFGLSQSVGIGSPNGAWGFGALQTSLGGQGIGSWNPQAAPGQINNSNPAYERAHQAEIDNVLRDPSLTVEDKVTLMIMLIMKKMDADIERQAQYINSIQQQQSNRGDTGGTGGKGGGKGGKGVGNLVGGQAGAASGTNNGSPSIDVETMKLKRMIDKRSQMFDMLRQIIDKYNQTAKGIIDSIGR